MKKIFNFAKKHLTIFIILFIFLFLFFCDRVNTQTGSMIMDNLKSIATSFTPTTDLFDDGSEVSFVSYFFGMKVNKKNEKLEFFYPSTCFKENEEEFSCENCSVIKTVASGQVIAVGYTDDNKKYVEIQHPNGYISHYIGLDNVGVLQNQTVKSKYPIGVSNACVVRVFITNNESTIKLKDIEWKS